MLAERSQGEDRSGEDLSTRVSATEAEVTALHERADRADDRVRACEADAEHDRLRIRQLEADAAVDRELMSELVAELVAEGTVSREHAANLEEALRSSRRIGAAIGIVMASQHVSEAAAFAVLRRASMDTNQRVRALADEVVVTGDLSTLRSR